jgi:hypothetical protein
MSPGMRVFIKFLSSALQIADGAMERRWEESNVPSAAWKYGKLGSVDGLLSTHCNL